MTRRGLAFLGAPTVPEMVELSRLAEEAGLESVWVAETRLTRDGFVPLAAMAMATRSIKLGTAIVNVFTRGPVLVGISFATLDELAGGRVIAGLGPGSPLVLKPQGVSFDRPLTRLREYIEVCRRLWTGDPVHFAGQTIQVDGAQLEFRPQRPDIPIYLGVTGPRALSLAGEVAEGILLNGFTSTTYTRRAVARVHEARSRGARSRAAEVVGLLVTSMDADARTARNRVRPFVAMYLAMFPNIAAETGYDEELILKVRAVFNQEGPERAAALVGDDIVDDLTVAGTPAQCQDRVDAYREAGVHVPVFCPLGENVDEIIRRLR